MSIATVIDQALTRRVSGVYEEGSSCHSAVGDLGIRDTASSDAAIYKEALPCRMAVVDWQICDGAGGPAPSVI
jgi:hypothetical protein